MTLFRFIILFCLLHMLAMTHDEIIHREGLILCQIKNLPHRGLGMLFYAHMKNPWRVDYCRDYLLNYFDYADNGWLIEGQKRPIVDMYAVVQARSFPRNYELTILRNIVMRNHQNWLKTQVKMEPKVESDFLEK